MSYGVDSVDVTGSLAKVAGVLGRLVDASGPDVGEEVRGVGTGGDGRVRAEVSAFGRLEALSIDATLLRVGTSVIAEYVLEAVRAAQDDAQRQSSELVGLVPGGLDPAELSATLGQVAGEATRGFDRMLGDLDAVLRRIDRR